ncbi:MAG: hypothetical protein CME80_17760 [Halomonas sp.]|nr:hypothetical protein [Halomonas sp.]|tara:strand:+ start:4436 stop:5299 length:864 start_codon:yes stop_codon:yes gene_type:complete
MFLISSIVYFSAYQEDHSNERQSDAEYQAKIGNNSPDACMPIVAESGIFDWLTCLANAVSSDSSAKQSQYDLNAQQDMAEWTLLMTIITGFMALVTVAGVIFVWLTLRETAAGVLVMREEQRPWVHAEIGRIEEFNIRRSGKIGDAAAKGLWMNLPVILKNSGKTPAQNVQITTTAHNWQGATETAKIEVIGRSDMVPVYLGSIAPNAQISACIDATREFSRADFTDNAPFFCFVVVAVMYGRSGSAQEFISTHTYKVDGVGSALTVEAIESGMQALTGQQWGGEMT